MNLIQAEWENEKCRVENGIFFPDDTFILLSGSPSQGFQAAIRQPLNVLTEASPDGWCAIDQVCSVEYESLSIVGGGTFYEGDGFLSITDIATRRLIWLLHLSGIERFTEIHVANFIIRAISAEYPFRHEWTIAIESPHTLLLEATKEY